MSSNLEGKIAVVSGSSRGIGLAVARELARQGCDCLLTGRFENTLSDAAGKLVEETGRRVEICASDLRTAEGCQAVHRTVVESFGGVDILINNAGATQGGDFLELADAIWEDGFALKFYACVRLSRLLWPMLTARRGNVVSIVGGFARTPEPDYMIGGAVNAAMANFTKALAGRGKRDDVNVNAIYPGFTETERVKRIFVARAEQTGVSPEQARDDIIKAQGIRRIGAPEDTAKLAAYLCSSGARHIQGTAIAVDGGATEGLF